ncbi:MAG: DUF1080 domain-containing protein [Planctomycetes bacterium]|nr:DUF1080 domain-containing protein [Planctomycetota bacterium]
MLSLVLACLPLVPSAQAAPEPAPVLGAGPDDVRLFDGESLTGWTTQGGRYDGHASWTVEDGVLTGRQGPQKSGGLIYTERAYENFIVSFDAWIDYPFDSGVFVRMVPPGGGKGAQVTLDYRPGGEVGAIYADGYLQHNEAGQARFRRDAWNRVVVRCTGRDMHLTAWLNGELLTDYRMPAGSEGYATKGLVGLQVHGGEDVEETQRVRFKDVWLRELPSYDAALFSCDDAGALACTDAAREAGWRPLFDGKSLAGWDPRPGPDAYRVRDGVIAFPKAGGGGELRTRELFRDFELRLDFKISRMANSGLFLRADPEHGNPAFSGCEIQILDDFNWEAVTSSKLAPYQFSGGLYGSLAPGDRHALRPLGEWNTYEVRYVGSRIAVKLNGALLYDVDTFTLEGNPPWQERVPRGFIGLQRHAPDEVEGEEYAWFRNLFVRPLDEEAAK